MAAGKARFGELVPQNRKKVPRSDSKFRWRPHPLVPPCIFKERWERSQGMERNIGIEPSGIRLPGEKAIFHVEILT